MPTNISIKPLHSAEWPMVSEILLMLINPLNQTLDLAMAGRLVALLDERRPELAVTLRELLDLEREVPAPTT
jgi:hypothetical protein